MTPRHTVLLSFIGAIVLAMVGIAGYQVSTQQQPAATQQGHVPDRNIAGVTNCHTLAGLRPRVTCVTIRAVRDGSPKRCTELSKGVRRSSDAQRFVATIDGEHVIVSPHNHCLVQYTALTGDTAACDYVNDYHRLANACHRFGDQS